LHQVLGSTFFLDLNGATPGNADTNYDQLVGGLASMLILETTGAGVALSSLVGFIPSPADVLRIVDNKSSTAVVGFCAGVPEGSQAYVGNG
jgi:hypothetical protein